MRRFFALFSSYTGVATIEDFIHAVQSFSLRQKLIWWTLILVFFASATYASYLANRTFLSEVPAEGGALTEGIIGVPRFINPILAISDADRDLVALVYAGIMRRSETGELVPDMAEAVDVSEDGLTYTVSLKPNLVWHNGEALTTEDIAFTIERAQDSAIKSPRRAAWEGVTTEILSPSSLRFHLKQPFSGFLENLTLGIMPKHLWKGIAPDLFALSSHNNRPVGSGPYKIMDVANSASGIPTSYTLEAFDDFALGKPYISSLTVVFFLNEETLVGALEDGAVESAGALSTDSAEAFKDKDIRFERSNLPRVFGVFWNQNQAPIFTDKAVRTALDMAIDKQAVVERVLHSYGTVAVGPIPPGSIGYEEKEIATSTLAEARTVLEDAGWTRNKESGIYEKTDSKKNVTRLAFSLATADIPELTTAGEMVSAAWETLGAKIDLKVFETSELNQSIIRPRKYDALLFGEVVGHEPDLFSFWHSSQRNDPGLNIALYANSDVDKALTEIRNTHAEEKRIALYTNVTNEIEKDAPASFLYSPEFIYILPRRIKKAEMASIVTGSERFSNIYKWFIETDNVWNIFLK